MVAYITVFLSGAIYTSIEQTFRRKTNPCFHFRIKEGLDIVLQTHYGIVAALD
jgi:hypothetical protein